MKGNLLSKAALVFSAILVSVLFSKAYAYDVTVAKDGTGNFTTIQAAVNAAPTGRTTAYTIYIKNGRYNEVVNVPSNKPFMQFIGQSAAQTIISYDNYSGKLIPGGGGTTYGTSTSATVTITAADCMMMNISMENGAGYIGDGPQALALYVSGDRCVFYNCRFNGGQDTVYAGGTGMRQYFKNCYIDGNTDFIFGDATAIFDTTVIYPRTRLDNSSGGYVTAVNTKATSPYGYVFRDCKLTVNRGTTFYTLGRPWQNDNNTADAAKSRNKTVFLNTVMGSSISPAGWSTWDAGTNTSYITYAEYKSKKFDGTLVDVSQRVAWSQQLTDPQAAAYYVNANIFGTWVPTAVWPDLNASFQPEIAVSNFRGLKGVSSSAFTWNLSWPISGITYDLYRSNDKIAFTKINTQVSTNDTALNFNYSEAIPPPGQTYYYVVRSSKTGLTTTVTDTVAISSTPTITVTGAPGSFVQGVGTPSTSQSYVVSGASLTNNLIITAPANYELSSNGGTTWNASSSPIVLTPAGNGSIPNTSIAIRLNAATAGTFSGNITHTSSGAASVNLAVTGTVQSGPLTVSQVLQLWPMNVDNSDSASFRATGVTASVPTFKNLYLSNGAAAPAVLAYSATHGQGFGPSSNGDGTWTTAAGGPGATLSRIYYEQFTVTAAATHSLKIDSLILTSSFYNSSSGTKLAVVYSKTGFVSDSMDVTGGLAADGTQLPGTANGAFLTPVLLANETAGTTLTYRLAFKGGTGDTIAAGQTLTFRLYFSCGSGNAGRYGKLKNVTVKGLPILNPVAGDYQSRQTGDWTNLATWERWDGTSWVTPAPSYPVYNNSGVTTILNGHTVTVSATLANGSGYIRRTKINSGAQLIVSAGANLNIANDGTPSTATTDLQVDGALTLFGGLFTNGNVSVVVNGSFVNSGTNLNLSNTGDTVKVGAAGTYQHNVNNGTTPNNMQWIAGSTFLITGITTNQTGIFKPAINYGNIVWNCTGESAYYAFRNTLNTNVQGSFTVVSTGTTNITFANASGKIAFPGGFYQSGGTVNFRENGNITDTLIIGSDFNITGGFFNSLGATGSTLLVQLTGINKSLNYAQTGAAFTNWEVSGIYNLGAGLALPTAGFGLNVTGTLNTSTYAVSGVGNFSLSPAAFMSVASPLGVNGNIITTGTNTFSNTANYIFNGTAAQVTGTLLPATVNGLTVNNSSDVTLTNSTTIASALTLSTGRLVLGNNNLVTPSVLNSSSTKYVVTNGTGALKINAIGVGSNLFPVGPTAAAYNPVTINNSGTVNNIAVKVKTTFDNTVPDANKVVNRQWTITPDAAGANVSAVFSWLAADQAAGFDPVAAITAIRYNGTAWVGNTATISGSGVAATPYLATTATGITAFGNFAVANSSVLPLQLVSFTAKNNDALVGLTWVTVNEVNTQQFVVERSASGNDFVTIGKVNAVNDKNGHSYSFDDISPLSGTAFYRLKMTDKDGAFTYSNVISVTRSLMVVTTYPNPATDILVVLHQKAKAGDKLEVITTDGKKVQSAVVLLGATESKIKVSALAPGLYFVNYTSANKTVVTRFVKN